ncbi:MAG: molybdopterin cofactor-binding domain-containing protein [Campylobacterota bacterium]|nr:molybdopterin cofactor-binding domain-containing protein [Campylobacterota bacterium]
MVTVASRTVMIVGELLAQTAKKLQDDIGKYKNINEYKNLAKNYTKTTKRFSSKYKKPTHIKWDEDKFYGNGYDGYSLGCYVAEIEVDPVTYQVKVTDFYAYQDVGKVINPILAEGQVEGGVAQGIGELPMNGPAVAIANALANALDIEFDTIPITPEIVEQKCR